jgi:hypothetical protein
MFKNPGLSIGRAMKYNDLTGSTPANDADPVHTQGHPQKRLGRVRPIALASISMSTDVPETFNVA